MCVLGFFFFPADSDSTFCKNTSQKVIICLQTLLPSLPLSNKFSIFFYHSLKTQNQISACRGVPVCFSWSVIHIITVNIRINTEYSHLLPIFPADTSCFSADTFCAGHVCGRGRGCGWDAGAVLPLHPEGPAVLSEAGGACWAASGPGAPPGRLLRAPHALWLRLRPWNVHGVSFRGFLAAEGTVLSLDPSADPLCPTCGGSSLPPRPPPA